MTVPERIRPRLVALGAVLVFLFGALVTRMWFLQVLAADEFRERAEGNRVRLVPLQAPRGKIFDRDGELLVGNKARVVITVDRSQVKNQEELVRGLSDQLGVPVADLVERLNDPRYLPFQPVPIIEDAPEDVVAYIAERRREFPGVDYETVGAREYVHGQLAAHLLGYLGEIGPQELEDPRFADYRPGDPIGRAGVERTYEPFLRGREGFVKRLVDARGKVLGPLGRQEPEAGFNVLLSLDADVQRVAEATLREGVGAARRIYDEGSGFYLRAPAGAVVVLDPWTGEVVAMASYPEYDPRVFLGGLSQREWNELRDVQANYPLSNRATQGLYPAASAIKPFVAAAAIKAGYASPGGYYNCPSEYIAPGDESGTVFHNWNPVNAGFISLSRALIESCDTVFYQFGWEFWKERNNRNEIFQRLLRKWGFDKPTGIDIPAENDGRVPDMEWKHNVHEIAPDLYPEDLWLPGDNINLSIGQGDLLVTPLQLAGAYAALANGGTVYEPHVVARIERPDGEVVRRIQPEITGEVPFRRPTIEAVASALRSVPVSGTAATAFAGFPLSQIPVAGKTGTAEVAGRQSHSWFAAYAPADHPEYVVVAIVEEGGHGSEVAAPIVRRIVEALFGIPGSEFHLGAPTD